MVIDEILQADADRLFKVDSPDLERIKRAGQTFVAVRATLVVPSDAEVARFARTMGDGS